MRDLQPNASDFRVMQFHALRAEILAIKERLIKLQTIGITGIPLVIGAADRYELAAVLIVSPLIVLAFAFMLLFEQYSLMRAGEYVRDYIETDLCPSCFAGWEHWLEQEPEHRRAEAFFAWSAHMVFAIYYAVVTWLAYALLVDKLEDAIAIAALGLYCGGFVIAFSVILTNFRGRTVPPVPTPPGARSQSSHRSRQ